MAFDKEYNKIINHQIQEDIDFSWVKTAFDWTTGKIKDGINWTIEKIQQAAKYLFNSFNGKNSQKIKPAAQTLVNKLPSEYKSQYDAMLKESQSQEFKKYYAQFILKKYSKQEYQNLSFSEKKNLAVQGLKAYHQSLASENIITQMPILITVIIWLVVIISGLFGTGYGLSFIGTKWNESFNKESPEYQAKQAQARRENEKTQHQHDLQMSKKEQDALNLALAN